MKNVRKLAVGVGVISESTTETSAGWPSVVRVVEHPRAHAIALRNTWRTTLILFCTPENYEQVAAAVRDRLEIAERKHSHAKAN